MNKLFIAFAAFVAVFFVHGFQFFKKQTPLVNALVVGLVVYFVAGFFGFIEGLVATGAGTTSDNYCCAESTGKVNTRAGTECLDGELNFGPTTATVLATAHKDCTKDYNQYLINNSGKNYTDGACAAEYCQTHADDSTTTCSGTGCCTHKLVIDADGTPTNALIFTKGVPSGGCTTGDCSTAGLCKQPSPPPLLQT